MVDHGAESWSVSLGHWRGIEVRLHIHFPLLALVVFFFAYQSPVVSYRIATMGLLVLLGSVALHELIRLLVAHRLGGQMDVAILGPTGGWTSPHLPVDVAAQVRRRCLVRERLLRLSRESGGRVARAARNFAVCYSQNVIAHGVAKLHAY